MTENPESNLYSDHNLIDKLRSQANTLERSLDAEVNITSKLIPVSADDIPPSDAERLREYSLRIKQDPDADTSEFAVRSFLAKIGSNGEIVRHYNWDGACGAGHDWYGYFRRSRRLHQGQVSTSEPTPTLIDTELVAGINRVDYYTAYYEYTHNDPRRHFILWRDRDTSYVYRALVPSHNGGLDPRVDNVVCISTSVLSEATFFIVARSDNSYDRHILWSNEDDESTLWKAKLTDNGSITEVGVAESNWTGESVECTKRVVFYRDRNTQYVWMARVAAGALGDPIPIRSGSDQRSNWIIRATIDGFNDGLWLIYSIVT